MTAVDRADRRAALVLDRTNELLVVILPQA
jgi:hypothetical protein